MWPYKLIISHRKALAAASLTVFSLGCSDATSELVKGAQGGPENPFLDESVVEAMIPDGPHLRPEIDYAILAEPNPREVEIDAQRATVELRGESAAAVAHLGTGDILALVNRSFQVERIERSAAATVVHLRPVRFEEILYGKFDYDLVPGGPNGVTIVDASTQEVSSGEQRAKSQLSLGQLCGRDSSGPSFSETVAENIASALQDQVLGRPEVNYSLDLTGDPTFDFKGYLPYHVGYSSDRLQGAELAAYEAARRYCANNPDVSFRGYCIQEFKALVNLGLDSSLSLQAQLGDDGTLDFEPDPVTLCQWPVPTNAVKPGIPLGPTPFRLVPTLKLAVGVKLNAEYPSSARGDYSLSVSPQYNIQVPVGYHYNSENGSEGRWAPSGFEKLSAGAAPPDEYTAYIQPSEDPFLEFTGLEPEPRKQDNTSLDAAVYVDLGFEISLEPVVASDIAQIKGPKAGVQAGLFGRWHPDSSGAQTDGGSGSTQDDGDGATQTGSCLEFGAYAQPYLEAKLRAEIDAWIFTAKFDLMPTVDLSSDPYEWIIWASEGSDYCFNLNPPLEIELRWQDERSDLDVLVVEPSLIRYRSGIDAETGMRHMQDVCPAGIAAACNQQPDSSGDYVEVIKVVEGQSGPEPGTPFTVRVVHADGDGTASYRLVVKQDGNEVQSFSGTLGPDDGEEYSFTVPNGGR